MRFSAVLTVFFMMLFSFTSPQTNAGDDGIQAQIEELKQQIERLEQQSRQMNMKMYEASDTKTRHNKIRVKTKKGTGLTFQTADKNYKIRMRLRGQFLANYLDTDTDLDDNEGFGFRVRRLRVTWDGNAFAPWMKYKVQYDFGRTGELKDMKLSFAKNKMFIPAVGQYKVPFNREALNSSSSLQVVGRSIITDHFEYDRDIGASAYGLLGGGMIRYDAGVFQGEGTNGKNDKDDTGLLWAGRVQAALFGGKAKKVKENFAKKPTLMVGAAVAGIDVEDSSDGNIGIPSEERELKSGKVTSFTADVNYRGPGFNLTGEYIGRWVNPDDAGVDTAYDYGFRVQGGFFVIPRKIEIASRYAMVVFDDDVPAVLKEVGEAENVEADKMWTFTQGLNYYLSGNHKWKVQFDYTFKRTESLAGVETDETMVRAQIQAYF